MARDDVSGFDTPERDEGRRRLMQACALASADELATAIEQIADAAAYEIVRQPEIGLVMLRGRVGGDGAPFNVGEATVTRAVVRLATGELGFSYLLGRSKMRARLAAYIDALGQIPGQRAQFDASFVAPVMQRVESERLARRAETAATRVQFFTLVRGED